MKRWPTMPVAPRIPTGVLLDIGSKHWILQHDLAAAGRGAQRPPIHDSGKGRGWVFYLTSRRELAAAKCVFIQRTKALLLGIELPASPDNAQAGHNRDREIDTQHARNLPARQHPKDRGQGVQFHFFTHDSRRDYVVL